MDQLTDTLEALQEELADDDFDVEYSVSFPFLLLALLSNGVWCVLYL